MSLLYYRKPHYNEACYNMRLSHEHIGCRPAVLKADNGPGLILRAMSKMCML